MFNARSGLLLTVAMIAGCTTASGPAYTKYSVALPNGESAYRVTCYGLLESPDVCRKEAEAICKDQPVRLLQGEALLGATSGGKPDDRNILFQCVARAQIAAPVPAMPATPMPPAATTLNADASFDTAQATLRSEARARLDHLIGQAKGASINTVTVNGYTDSIGSDAYNQDLSEGRANTVASYLRDHGLKASRFISHGYGKADPVDTNATEEGRARNRRVDVLLDLNRN